MMIQVQTAEHPSTAQRFHDQKAVIDTDEDASLPRDWQQKDHQRHREKKNRSRSKLFQDSSKSFHTNNTKGTAATEMESLANESTSRYASQSQSQSSSSSYVMTMMVQPIKQRVSAQDIKAFTAQSRSSSRQSDATSAISPMSPLSVTNTGSLSIYELPADAWPTESIQVQQRKREKSSKQKSSRKPVMTPSSVTPSLSSSAVSTNSHRPTTTWTLHPSSLPPPPRMFKTKKSQRYLINNEDPKSKGSTTSTTIQQSTKNSAPPIRSIKSHQSQQSRPTTVQSKSAPTLNCTRRNMMERSTSMTALSRKSCPALHSLFQWSSQKSNTMNDGATFDAPRGHTMLSQRKLIMAASSDGNKTMKLRNNSMSTSYSMTPSWPPNKQVSSRTLHAQFYERTLGQQSQPVEQQHPNGPARVTTLQMLDIMEPCTTRERLTFLNGGMTQERDAFVQQNRMNYSGILDDDRSTDSEYGEKSPMPPNSWHDESHTSSARKNME